jgi:hypothetical protein
MIKENDNRNYCGNVLPEINYYPKWVISAS